MRTVVFLDIDGVLNTSNTTERCCGYIGIESAKVALLKQIIDATNADIVLSSTWKHQWKSGKRGGPTTMGHYLIKKFAKYGLTIFDKTPDIKWRARAKEIRVWIENNQPVDRIIILDDEDFYYEDVLNKFWVCTQNTHYIWTMTPGLTQDNVDFILNNLEDFTIGDNGIWK